ncbi:MAG: MerR family transcriptional regulator [Cyclobacteriaceae bacterium]|nr:MerR family transcriptional regulator [Cyclobacteriaceae bacterium]
MARYSIKELEELSGIKAHTIRIWEKRYGIVLPSRTASNIRTYSDDDLKKIITVSLLNNHGVKISKIASLSPAEMANRVTELSQHENSPELHIDRLVVAMVDLDEEKFEGILNELIARFGFESAILEIVYPFLEKIGVLWLTGNITPLQEHFITNLLRQKMLVAIDGLPLATKAAPRVILFLPDEELHELGLLFSYYQVKKAGFRSYYMGQRVPYQDVCWFCEHHKPVAMITAITTSPSPAFVEPYLHRICKDHPAVTVLAGGHQLKKMALRIPQNLHIIEDARHLKTLLQGLKSV